MRGAWENSVFSSAVESSAGEAKKNTRKSVFIARRVELLLPHNVLVYDYISHSNLHKRPIKDIKWSSSRSILNCFSTPGYCLSIVVIITFLFLLFNYSLSDFSSHLLPHWFHYIPEEEKRRQAIKMASRSGVALPSERRERKRSSKRSGVVKYRLKSKVVNLYNSWPLKCFYSAIKLLDNCINAGQCLIK